MKSLKAKIIGVISIVSVTIFLSLWSSILSLYQQCIDDPKIWKSAIANFEQVDKVTLVNNQNRVLFIGSSSFRLWTSLEGDMEPLRVINRGFGGAKIHQINYYFDRVVMPYNPSRIVYYAGDNDLGWPSPKSPEEALEDFKVFMSLVHSKLTNAKVYFVSIKPSFLRKRNWPQMKVLNKLIREYSLEKSNLVYLDTATHMFDSNQELRDDIFKWDGLHLNNTGYKIFRNVIKSALMN
jgi:lysophospholipase L1-like esterase